MPLIYTASQVLRSSIPASLPARWACATAVLDFLQRQQHASIVSAAADPPSSILPDCQFAAAARLNGTASSHAERSTAQPISGKSSSNSSILSSKSSSNFSNSSSDSSSSSSSGILRRSSAGSRKTIAVGMSGGVDSAVSAMLLKQQGHDVVGVFMHNWDEAEEGDQCTSEQDLKAAEAVCRQLHIPLHQASFVTDYWHRVFTRFVAEYSRGLTPNPDLECNRHIKFGCLMEWALSRGADAVATGHYARLRPSAEGGMQLLRGADTDKDQSYFLASVPSASLRHAVFPVGGMSKQTVRKLASEAGLASALRRSSAGICFIGRRNFDDFLEQYCPAIPGSFVDVDSGMHVGACSNIAAITHGQRAPIGGTPDRVYVVGKHVASRRVYVAMGRDHPALSCYQAILHSPSWLTSHTPIALAAGQPLQCMSMTRYRQAPRHCSIGSIEPGKQGFIDDVRPSMYCSLLPEDMQLQEPDLKVTFRQPEAAVTPQQACVLYDGEVVLGSTLVRYPMASLHELDAAASGEATSESEPAAARMGVH